MMELEPPRAAKLATLRRYRREGSGIKDTSREDVPPRCQKGRWWRGTSLEVKKGRSSVGSESGWCLTPSLYSSTNTHSELQTNIDNTKVATKQCPISQFITVDV
ncbi:hypothetical protein BgiBS90_008695 [Biomphalaria glabrata]|nr:hypothetical protein BgiBS90_008695 [Biomphalaria glabrata]